MNRVTLYLGCLLLLFSVLDLTAQPLHEYHVKAVFIYNFTHFVDWPPQCFEDDQAPFIIGVLGKNVFGPALEETIAGEAFNNHKITVRYYDSSANIEECHILFISKSYPGVKEAVAALKGKPILTVSDRETFMEEAGMLRFYVQNNKIRLQINQQTAADSGLVISSKLLSLATPYQR